MAVERKQQQNEDMWTIPQFSLNHLHFYPHAAGFRNIPHQQGRVGRFTQNSRVLTFTQHSVLIPIMWGCVHKTIVFLYFWKEAEHFKLARICITWFSVIFSSPYFQLYEKCFLCNKWLKFLPDLFVKTFVSFQLMLLVCGRKLENQTAIDHYPNPGLNPGPSLDRSQSIKVNT